MCAQPQVVVGVRAAFGEHDVPSTLMGVTVLGYDDQLVEPASVVVLRE